MVPTVIGRAHQRPAGQKERWSVERLREEFESETDTTAGRRATELLDWAVESGAFVSSIAKEPCFGLNGRSGKRIVSVAASGIYFYLVPDMYPEGERERDRLVADLKSLDLYPPELDPAEVASGRNLTRPITDLSDEEMQRFLETCGRHCKRA